MTNYLSVPALLQKMNTLVDGTWRLTFEVNEINDETATQLVKHNQQFGTLVFATEKEKVKVEDIKVPENDEGDPKSPSQRLRDRLFAYYINSYGEEAKKDFYDWYKKELDRLGERYLERLN